MLILHCTVSLLRLINMSIYTKFITPPDLTGGQDVFNASLKKFFVDLDELFMAAGFLRSNTNGNIDFDNINYVTLDFTVSGFMQTSYIEYDFNDSNQTTLPIRIRITHYLYRYSATDKYPYFNVIETSIGSIGIQTNEMRNVVKFISSDIRNYSSSSTNGSLGTPFSYNSDMNSVITVKDDVVSVCIIPEYIQSALSSGPSKSHVLPFAEFIIERISPNAVNVYHAKGSDVYSGTLLHIVSYIDNNTTYDTDSYFVYNNIPTYLSEGKLISFPVFNVGATKELTQSKNLILCKKSAINASAIIDMKVDDVDAKFVGMTAENRYISSDARLLVRFE